MGIHPQFAAPALGSGGGAGNIILTGGLSQFNVLFNVTGTGSTVNFLNKTTGNPAADVLSGIVLAPFRDITLSTATVNGEIIGGNLSLTNSTVSVPEPATLALFASGVAALGAKLRRRRKSS